MSDVATYRLDAYEKRADIADARMQYIGRGLIRDETSIHVEGLPGDVPGLVRRQERHHRGDILWIGAIGVCALILLGSALSACGNSGDPAAASDAFCQPGVCLGSTGSASLPSSVRRLH
jgi:hypothetical protein